MSIRLAVSETFSTAVMIVFMLLKSSMDKYLLASWAQMQLFQIVFCVLA